MATEYTCITRKIEVHLHRHGDDEDAVQRYKNEFQIWNEINNNLYKVANFIYEKDTDYHYLHCCSSAVGWRKKH